MSSIDFIWVFTWQGNHRDIKSNRAQLFLRNKYAVFTTGDTVALLFMTGELHICSYIQLYTYIYRSVNIWAQGITFFSFVMHVYQRRFRTGALGARVTRVRNWGETGERWWCFRTLFWGDNDIISFIEIFWKY